MYQKTHGKRHKLCIGQNKKHRRWKLTAPIDQKINPQENELDKTETDMVILGLSPLTNQYIGLYTFKEKSTTIF